VAIITDNALTLKRNLQKDLKVKTENIPVFEHKALGTTSDKNRGSNSALPERPKAPEVKPVAEIVRVRAPDMDRDFGR
jgi:hypothetical protein